MNMKKAYIRLLALLLVVLPVTAAAQFRLAPVAGVNVNSLKFKQELVPVGHSVGFQAGVMAEMMFPGIGFGIDFGLLYNMEGAKVNLGSRKLWASEGFGNENLNLHVIQIPLHLRFKWTRMNGLEDYIAPFVYGGPEFGILAGHSTFKGTSGEHPFKYAGGDLSVSAGGGVELFRRWQLSFQYSWGMTYALKTKLLDNYSARSRSYSVRLAYFF